MEGSQPSPIVPDTAGVSRLADNIRLVYQGRRETVELVLTCLLAGGHLLIEDVPGVGKTTLARALAQSLHCDFRRIQFTPDLMPSDIVGVSIYDNAAGEFVFKPGPIFANIVLADEINRTNPRVQSSLLEAMSERQVSVDGVSHPLELPFMVIATQNPFDFEGTYPLPESQLDRFLMRLRLGYPTVDEERSVLLDQRLSHPLEALEPVLDGREVVQLVGAVRGVTVEAPLVDYMLELVRRTRSEAQVKTGVSPRGSLALYRAAQAHAVVLGRDYVIPDDVKAVAGQVLAHRLIFERTARTEDAGEALIRRLLGSIPCPS